MGGNGGGNGDRYRRLGAVLAMAAVLAAGTVDRANAEPPSNRTIVEHFNIIAFGNEYTQQRFERIRKLRKPVIARIDGNPPAYFEDFVRQHLAELSKITGHPRKAGLFGQDAPRKAAGQGAQRQKLQHVPAVLPDARIDRRGPPTTGR